MWNRYRWKNDWHNESAIEIETILVRFDFASINTSSAWLRPTWFRLNFHPLQSLHATEFQHGMSIIKMRTFPTPKMKMLWATYSHDFGLFYCRPTQIFSIVEQRANEKRFWRLLGKREKCPKNTNNVHPISQRIHRLCRYLCTPFLDARTRDAFTCLTFNDFSIQITIVVDAFSSLRFYFAFFYLLCLKSSALSSPSLFNFLLVFLHNENPEWTNCVDKLHAGDIQWQQWNGKNHRALLPLRMMTRWDDDTNLSSWKCYFLYFDLMFAFRLWLNAIELMLLHDKMDAMKMWQRKMWKGTSNEALKVKEKRENKILGKPTLIVIYLRSARALFHKKSIAKKRKKRNK